MVQEPFAQPEYREGIDADAVCGQCGSVNPEGTLLCKTCGNNLRDQRLLRMTADQMLEAEVDGIPAKSSFLLKALPILGLLVVLWLGLNAGRIASMLVSVDDGSGGAMISTQPGSFWDGPDQEVYNALRSELMQRFPALSEAETARMEPTPVMTYNDGLYVLYVRQGGAERFAGAALARAQNGVCYYTAWINNSIEVRGKAPITENFMASQWDEAAMAQEGLYYAAAGVAVFQANGTINVSCQTDLDSLRYQATAYRMGSF